MSNLSIRGLKFPQRHFPVPAVFYHNYFPMLLRLILAAFCATAALAQCTFTLNPSSASFNANSNDQVVSISASASNCAWTATSNTSWITVSFGPSGTGNGSMGFTVLQNNTFAQRTGSLRIAGTTFNVTQAGATCTYSLSPSSVTAPAGGSNGTFNVSSPCSWTATSNASWLTATGSATGNGTVSYTAAPNAGLSSRSGTISVGTQNFTVTQSASCNFTVNPTVAQISPGGGTGTFQVQASATSCTWTATSNNPDFLTVTSGASGTGNGTVGYAVSANSGSDGRGGSIAVGNTSFGIFQPGSVACNFVLTPAAASFPSSGGSGNFTVASGCPWTPSTSADWINITSAPGNGNGAVTYYVLPNTASIPRSASIQIGTSTFSVNEAAVACAVTVSSNLLSAPVDGASGAIDVSAPDGCNWTAATAAPWIALSPSSGTGNGSFSYNIAANTQPRPRTAVIAVANQSISVSQDAATCTPSLTPDHASVPSSAGAYSFHISTACDYTAVSNSGWIKIAAAASGSGSSDIGYSVAANSSSDARSGSVSIAGLTFAISQSGTSCSLSLDPTSATIPAAGGSGFFNVTATASCRWEPASDASWIRFSYASANGNGRVNYTVDRAADPAPRAGNIFIAGQTFAISQPGRPDVQISSAGVVNAASFVNAAVAPGEIVTIFGTGIGPADLTTLQLSADGQTVLSGLAGVRVLFDNTAAPLLYVSSSQIAAIVPYEIAGQTSVQMRVEVQGFPSDPVTLDVAPAAPAIFTLDSSGSGQGAILNQDLSGNSAANPAAKGSVIVLYATGEGQTNPKGIDGRLAGANPPKPVLPVTVQIGGIAATVLYAGGAPQLPAGVLQVNVRVPPQAPSGAVPVILRVGAVAAPPVTAALQD